MVIYHRVQNKMQFSFKEPKKDPRVQNYQILMNTFNWREVDHWSSDCTESLKIQKIVKIRRIQRYPKISKDYTKIEKISKEFTNFTMITKNYKYFKVACTPDFKSGIVQSFPSVIVITFSNINNICIKTETLNFQLLVQSIQNLLDFMKPRSKILQMKPNSSNKFKLLYSHSPFLPPFSSFSLCLSHSSNPLESPSGTFPLFQGRQRQ